MLAAAGSASAHPHAADEDSIRTRWDRDVANAPADIAELSRFFASVLDHDVTSADSVQQRAATYYGTQGPWYTVGWLMASTVEQALGRTARIRSLCKPAQFIEEYNSVARQANSSGRALPSWDSALVSRLQALRR